MRSPTSSFPVSTFAGPPAWPQYPSYQADNYNLEALASADNQPYMFTLFPQPVSTVFLLERGADDGGYVQALDNGGIPLGVAIPFGPGDYLDTGYTFLGQTGGGLRIDSEVPIYGIVIFPPDGGPLGVDPVSIAGIPVLP